MSGVVALMEFDSCGGTAPQCRACGFVPPGDCRPIPAGLRSVAADYATAVRRLADARQAAAENGSNLAGSWSAAGCVFHVADTLDVCAERLEQFRIFDRPCLDGLDGGEPPAAGDMDLAIRRLAATTERVAQTVESMPPELWSRTGVLGCVEVSALEIARWAWHESVHHLGDLPTAVVNPLAPK